MDNTPRDKVNRLVKSVDPSTPMLRAAHGGSVAALNDQPQSDNPYKGKSRLWRAWNEGCTNHHYVLNFVPWLTNKAENEK